jgi:hypothetical protein
MPDTTRLDKIEKRLGEIERILFGEEKDKAGMYSKVKEIYEQFVFFKRIYKVVMWYLSLSTIALIGILLHLVFHTI